MPQIPVEKAFPNEPEFIAKRLLLDEEGALVLVLQDIGQRIGKRLKEHCTPLRPDDELPYAYIAKHARDGVRVALEETLYAAMNEELGLPKDYQP